MGFVLDCVSDSHDTHDDLVFPPFEPRPGDRWVLLHGGDFSYRGTGGEISRYLRWLSGLPHERKVVICGNHELSFDEATAGGETVRGEEVFRGVADYLEEATLDLDGLKIFGSPYSVRFFDWAFQVDPGDDAAERWSKIPAGTDVVLVHGPPRGHGDACPDHGRRGAGEPPRLVHVGDPELLQRLRLVKPAVCVFGHIHEGFGVTRDEGSDAVLVNASCLDAAYEPRGTFVRITLDDEKRVVSTSIERFARR